MHFNSCMGNSNESVTCSAHSEITLPGKHSKAESGRAVGLTAWRGSSDGGPAFQAEQGCFKRAM